MPLILNPGTEARPAATLDNARVVAERIKAALNLSDPISRQPEADRDGWFRFIFTAGPNTVEVDIPGDDPESVIMGIPFRSRRLYVAGLSWLYGLALGMIEEHLGLEGE